MEKDILNTYQKTENKYINKESLKGRLISISQRLNHHEYVDCNLCKKNKFKTLFNREFKVGLCRNCSLVCLRDEQRDYKKYYSHEYSFGKVVFNGKETNLFFEDQEYSKNVVNWIINNLSVKKNNKLLEIGSNSGFLLKRLTNEEIDVFGIESSKDAVRFSKKVNKLKNIECSMFEESKEVKEIYDSVILIQTLEHFKDPSKVLEKVKRFMKKDGTLFIEVPNYYTSGGLYRSKVKGVYYPSRNHLFVYSFDTLSALLKKLGFCLIDVSYHSMELRVVAKIDYKKEHHKIKFGNYYKSLLYFYLLPLLRYFTK